MAAVDPPDQAGEDAVDGIDLGFAEVVDAGQKQVGHLPEDLGIVLGSALSAPFNSARRVDETAVIMRSTRVAASRGCTGTARSPLNEGNFDASRQ